MFNMNAGKKPYHIFLTGEKMIGKSYLVNKILESTDLKWSGIKSVSFFENGVRNICITDATNDDVNSCRICARCKDGKLLDCNPSVFDSYGSQLLEVKKGIQLIVIDEVGFIEKDAEKYTHTVLSLLDRTDIHVLGVVRQNSSNPLCQTILSHENVKTFVIKKANRNNMAPVVDRLLHDRFRK